MSCTNIRVLQSLIYNKIIIFVTRTFYGYNEKQGHNALIINSCKIRNNMNSSLARKNKTGFYSDSGFRFHPSLQGTASNSPRVM